MNLSHLGVIADILWYEILYHLKYVELGDFVFMPNHIHGILILDKPVVETGNAVKSRSDSQSKRWVNVQTIGQKRFQHIGKNTVSSTIGSYKSAVT
jgi:putative transposase